MAAHAEQLAASWSDNETFELTATMTGLTMGILAKVMLNSEVSAEVDELATRFRRSSPGSMRRSPASSLFLCGSRRRLTGERGEPARCFATVSAR